MKKINLNSVIKVKLTPLGADIFYHRYDEINQKIKAHGGIPLEPKMPKIDEAGFTQFQLWDFINLYGGCFTLGVANYPIDSLNIYIDEKNLDDL